jgi:hypothetical protein
VVSSGAAHGLAASAWGAASAVGGAVGNALSAAAQNEIAIYFAKTVVAWSVPAIVLGILVGVVADLFKSDGDESEEGLFGALGKLLGDRDDKGMPKPQKKSFGLKVTRLNDRYEAVSDLFEEAYNGKEAAR